MGLTPQFQWWELWTCHLAHWDTAHLLLNLAAVIPPLLLLPRRFFGRLAAGLVVSAPLLSFGLLITGSIDGEYRGASGVVMAVWFYSATALLRTGETAAGTILLAAITAKLLAEWGGWWPQATTSFTTLQVAHYLGALGGLALAAAQTHSFGALPRRDANEREMARPL